MTDIKTVLLVLLLWNLIVFALYGIDKVKAKRGGRRIIAPLTKPCLRNLGGLLAA